MMTRRVSLALLTAATLLAAGCQKEEELRVSDGWVRLSAVTSNPSAAYFTIHGGPADTRLLSVSTDRAIRSEIHKSMKSGNMASMEPLRSLDVAAHSTIKFEPGGMHVMLYNINPGVKPGDRMPLIFTFANGERIEYDAPVQAMGDAAPAQGK